ncbi:hypothetical protein EYD45_07545 [Hyunsoonleella flava]|uniref:DUF6443 domain-containing protein n=2 Tax=Pseudomonadati TaxID=3379134 RepID=A0A4V2JA82_9FLAO|nr:DUF6443 domain-containing protein [Hyunsoonleella flava]TBN04485.1 hypothetical protein EYD45_07545 [Hyunsoonleella flava]
MNTCHTNSTSKITIVLLFLLMLTVNITAQNTYIQGPTKVHENATETYTLDNLNGNINPGLTSWYWQAFDNDINDYHNDSITGASFEIEFSHLSEYEIYAELYDSNSNFVDDGSLAVTVIPAIPDTPPNPIFLSSTTGTVTIQRVGEPHTDMDITWYWQGSPTGTSTSYGSGETIVLPSGATACYLRAYNAHSGFWSEDSGEITKKPYYQDSDGDGLGDPNSSTPPQWTQPSGYVDNDDDQCPFLQGTEANNGCPIVDCTLSDQNYVYTITPTEGVNNLGSLSSNQRRESVMYYDGLGRPMQSIAIRAGGQGQDIITHIDYDTFGRQDKNYLPYVMTSSCGQYQTNALTATNNFYNTLKYENTLNPYSEMHLESSPLNRVLEQGAPGNDWAVDKTSDNDHTIKFEYGANTEADMVRFFEVDLTCGSPTLVESGTYKPNELYKTITKDENWQPNNSYEKNHTTEEYKDKQGRVILKRTFDKIKWHDTYYVYDDYGSLTFVLPPELPTYLGLLQNDIHYSEYFSSGSLPSDFAFFATGSGHDYFEMSISLSSGSGRFSSYGYLEGSPNVPLNSGKVTSLDIDIDMDASYIDLGDITFYSELGEEYTLGTAYIQNGDLYFNSNGVTISAGGDFSFRSETLFHLQSTNPTIITETDLNNLAYQYKYDERNRLVEKKIPGKEKEYIVYDNLDRPILTQDANLRADNKWLFTKYDVFGRIVYTGIYTHPSLQDQNQMQGNLDAFYTTNTSNNLYESKQASEGSYNYYSNQSFPNTNIEILTVNYYDDYSFNTDGQALPSSWDGQDIINHNNSSSSKKLTKGLATGSRVKVLEQPNWITRVTGYDAKARPIYVMSKNTYLGSTDIVKNTLDFTGAVDKMVTEHNKGTNTIITEDLFTYDHMGRLKKHTQELNNTNALEVIVENHYDELGQLESKGVGGSNTNTNRLQNVDYTYNIRGWLKTINDPYNIGNDLFSFGLTYNQPEGAVTGSITPLYNGNISHTLWKTNNDDNRIKEYRYNYDALNRLTNANWAEGGTSVAKYNVSIGYDRNGNILRMNRNMPMDLNNPLNMWFGGSKAMDALTYSYYGNKLLNVKDGIGLSTTGIEGFKDGNVKANTGLDDYTYDANGNMVKDLNKGINTIEYNHLNLPTKVTFDSNVGDISYVYDATGVKQKKKVFSYANGWPTTTVYAGNYTYINEDDGEGDVLKFFNHPEGYIEPDNQGGYNYAYQYNDHLGNVRLTYINIGTASNPNLEIIEENNYYPFGLEHKGYNNVVNGVENKYETFQGVEYEESLGLNLYEMDWRQYDPAIARWTGIDPVTHYQQSTYTAFDNNPVYFADPSGTTSTAEWMEENGITQDDLITVYQASDDSDDSDDDNDDENKLRKKRQELRQNLDDAQNALTNASRMKRVISQLGKYNQGADAIMHVLNQLKEQNDEIKRKYKEDPTKLEGVIEALVADIIVIYEKNGKWDVNIDWKKPGGSDLDTAISVSNFGFTAGTDAALKGYYGKAVMTANGVATLKVKALENKVRQLENELRSVEKQLNKMNKPSSTESGGFSDGFGGGSFGGGGASGSWKENKN